MAEDRGRVRRAITIGISVVALAAAGLVGFSLLGPDHGDDTDTAVSDEQSYAVGQVIRGTLTVRSSITGRVDHGPASVIPIRASGTVTWLPQSGRTVIRGRPLLRVDDRPVVLLYGATPAFRPLGEGTTNDASGTGKPAPRSEPLTGRDVLQLEKNLTALGYGGFDVDDTFTASTAAAVEQWQADLGVPETGRVEFGDVVFLPGPIRVVADPAALGQDAAGSAIRQTATQRVVTASAAADSVGWATPGTRVTVTLPSQRSTSATVVGVGNEASESSDGPGTVTVRFTLDHPRRIHESGPVTISYISRRARDVLTVPVTALVALAEGGYGVQLDEPGEVFVPVTPGLYADGNVAIDGGLQPGTKIRVPR